jgi:hypothetical protein
MQPEIERHAETNEYCRIDNIAFGFNPTKVVYKIFQGKKPLKHTIFNL